MQYYIPHAVDDDISNAEMDLVSYDAMWMPSCYSYGRFLAAVRVAILVYTKIAHWKTVRKKLRFRQLPVSGYWMFVIKRKEVAMQVPSYFRYQNPHHKAESSSVWLAPTVVCLVSRYSSLSRLPTTSYSTVYHLQVTKKAREVAKNQV